MTQPSKHITGIQLLANQVWEEPAGWYTKPEYCSHMFNHSGVFADSPSPRCCVCNTPNPNYTD